MRFFFPPPSPCDLSEPFLVSQDQITFTISYDVLISAAITGGSFNIRVVPSSLLVAEKEEAKAVLNLFLKKQGLSHITATRTINKAEFFVDHLISRLHSVYKSRYLVGSIQHIPSDTLSSMISHIYKCRELINFY